MALWSLIIMIMMKSILIVLIIVTAFTSCNHRESDKRNIHKSTPIKTIEVPVAYDNLILSDSLFEKLDAIPLETTDDCLISNPQKILIQFNKIFVQDFNKSLYSFDMNGKFMKKIGKKGRGPGEYISLAGFTTDKFGNIYILDYYKILKYNTEGNFENSIPLKLNSKGLTCYPEQFVIWEDDFYLWSGSVGIGENKNNNQFAMYRVSQDNELIENHFLVEHKIMNSFCRFRQYNDIYNIDPIFGNDTIYSITSNGVTGRYHIDFGKKAIKKKIPNEFNSFSEFKARIAPECSFSPRTFVETNDWVYFIFSHNFSYYSAYHSKKLKKTFVSLAYPKASSTNSFVNYIESCHGDDFIVLIDPVEIINLMDDFSITNKKLSNCSRDVELINKLKNVSLTDNPILFICNMKKYE